MGRPRAGAVVRLDAPLDVKELAYVARTVSDRDHADASHRLVLPVVGRPALGRRDLLRARPVRFRERRRADGIRRLCCRLRSKPAAMSDIQPREI